MALSKKTTVKSLTVSEKEGPKGPYKLYSVTTTDGESFVVFGNKDSEHPYVNKKEVTALQNGSDIEMIYEKSGKLTKILSLSVTGQSEPEGSFISTGAAIPAVDIRSTNSNQLAASQGVYTQGIFKSEAQKVPLTTRDVSMELSGILQSLVSTGRYHDEVQNEKGTSTYINLKLMEAHAQKILELKDKLAGSRG